MFAALPRGVAPCCDWAMSSTDSESRCGLGLDAGGTATRWLLIDERGHEHARGEVAGFSATQLGTVQQPLPDAALAELAAALGPWPRPTHLYGGLTGFDGLAGDAPGALHQRMAQALGIDAAAACSTTAAAATGSRAKRCAACGGAKTPRPAPGPAVAGIGCCR